MGVGRGMCAIYGVETQKTKDDIHKVDVSGIRNTYDQLDFKSEKQGLLDC